MADLAIITPTRGRPERFAEMCRAAFDLAEGSIEIYGGIDDDDDVAAYLSAMRPSVGGTVVLVPGPRHSLSAWTNHLAEMALAGSWLTQDGDAWVVDNEIPDPPRYLASLGDDHRPRTPAWDRLLIDAIEERGGSGFAYGNDLAQGWRLPTAWVVSADIVRAVGWLMLPVCQHMYVDNATLALGEALDRITYVPGVIIEHLHPAVGKAAMDASYAESNTAERYEADRLAFEAWRDDEGGGLRGDVWRVKLHEEIP